MAKTLKNESKRKFQFGADFKNQQFFKPGEVAIFDDETAEVLLQHGGVVDVNDYKVAFDNTKVEDHTGKKKSAKSKPAGYKSDALKDKSAAPSDAELAAALKE